LGRHLLQGVFNGVRLFRTRLPGRVFGYLFSAPSERLKDYCKYQENDSLPEIEFVGGDDKIPFAKIYSSVLDCAY
jgi:hypothetical protein